MKNISAYFSEEALKELHNQLDIVLIDSYDYSKDELGALYEKVTEDFPYEFAADGTPMRMGRIFEEIVDALIKLGTL